MACTPRAAGRKPHRCRTIAGAPWHSDSTPGPPLPTQSTGPLGFLLETYLEVENDGADIFPNPDAAARGEDAIERQGGGFVYFASGSSTSVGDQRIYRTTRGSVRSEDVRSAHPSEFQGFAFYRSPQRPFGWLTAGGICPRTEPSPQAPIAERCFTRYQRVDILGIERTERGPWIQISESAWVLDEYVARVDPEVSKPDAVESDRWIEVNLAEQTVTVYEDQQLVYATVASSGRSGFWTQPGTFQVWAKLERDNITGGSPGSDGYYFLENVPWVLYFDQARALHGTYWHNRFGSPRSRGCVNLSPADAGWVYQFAQEGTWVHVYDPTGETPTDPDLYGAGGA